MSEPLSTEAKLIAKLLESYQKEAVNLKSQVKQLETENDRIRFENSRLQYLLSQAEQKR